MIRQRLTSITCLFILILITLSGCLISPPGEVNPIGRWLEVETKATLKISFIPLSESWIYDPDIDQYDDACFIDISDSVFTLYFNSPDSGYAAVNLDIQLTSDSIMFYSLDHQDSSGTPDSIRLGIRKNWSNQLVLSISEKSEGTEIIFETIYEPYSGAFPPSSWTHPITDDSYEPDDTATSATPIGISEVQSHSLTTFDRDYYAFDADSGTTYQLNILAYRELQQWLIAPDRQTVLAHDMDNEDRIDRLDNTLESIILWNCDSSATYYCRVAMEDSLQQCNYQYQIKRSSKTASTDSENSAGTGLSPTSVTKKILQHF